jgi:hypothetical protein
MVSAACALSEIKTTPSARFLALVVIRYAYVMRSLRLQQSLDAQFRIKTLSTELLIYACQKNAWNLGRLVGLCRCGCSSSSIVVESSLSTQPPDARVDVGSLILVDPAGWDPFG